MTVTAIVGANWGDEGKGKVTDVLAAQSDFVVRYQGGSNAGHTIINEYGKSVLHLLPSGVFYPGVTNVIGPGVALNISDFLQERDALLEKGVPEPRFDAVATKYGCQIQGATEVVLTNLDVLSYLDEIQVCTAYKIDGDLTEEFPVASRLDHAKPVWEGLGGWKSDISDIRRFNQLPLQAQEYVLKLESWIGVRVRWVSIGPRREQMIER